LNSGNVLIQHLSEKCDFRVSAFAGSAEAQVIWGAGTVKRILIAYFGLTFLPKNIKIHSHMSKL